ncbi:MAG TPA: glutamyl-tRNA reductase [Ktedonobacteraceae bacterium]|nr:glutamyl-tRNA reductase [Ktedonobacteraceae bacterium]
MHIVCIGVDYLSAPIDLRERLACSQLQVPQVLRSARQFAQECVLLSTCNRIELYAVCSEPGEGLAHLQDLLCKAREVALSEFIAHSYSFVDQQAVEHLLGVACGLYSLVPGEPQIQGQVAEALEIAQDGGFAGPITSALFRSALVAGKRARSETAISRNAASISHVAVQLARQLFPHLREASVLLVGSGKMSELAAQNLCAHGVQRLTIINRTQGHAIDLANRVGALHRSFAELSAALLEADVVISSTTAPHTIITCDILQDLVLQRQGRLLLLIDIALPRDIDPAVAELPGVHLYNLDDLQNAVNEGIRLRLQETEQVRAIISTEAAAFERWFRSLSVVDTISELRRHVDILRTQELARTLNLLAPSLSERETAAVQELTTRLVNKILHMPTRRLKDAAASGQGHMYAEALRYLFDVKEQSHETFDNRHTSQQTGDDTDTLGRSTAPAPLARPGDSC